MIAIIESHWDLERIRSHFATRLPLAALLGIEVVAAERSNARVRLVGSKAIAHPGGMVAGPILFAMADMASYALTLVLRQAEDALTSNLLINFFRPAFDHRCWARLSRCEQDASFSHMTFASCPKQRVQISLWRKQLRTGISLAVPDSRTPSRPGATMLEAHQMR
jgi:uncharacterized protein (TIGR00369 family)